MQEQHSCGVPNLFSLSSAMPPVQSCRRLLLCPDSVHEPDWGFFIRGFYSHMNMVNARKGLIIFMKGDVIMARRLGRNQQEGMRQLVANGDGNMRRMIGQAQRAADAAGTSVIREMQRLAASGNAVAQTAIATLRSGGASVGDSTG